MIHSFTVTFLTLTLLVEFLNFLFIAMHYEVFEYEF